MYVELFRSSRHFLFYTFTIIYYYLFSSLTYIIYFVCSPLQHACRCLRPSESLLQASSPEPQSHEMHKVTRSRSIHELVGADPFSNGHHKPHIEDMIEEAGDSDEGGGPLDTTDLFASMRGMRFKHKYSGEKVLVDIHVFRR